MLTQNVDCFHHQAGSHNVIEMHGNIHEIRCTQCDYSNDSPDYAHLTIPPRCPACNGILRPNVVLFGEMLPDEQVACYEDQMQLGFDIVFSIGTTSVFPYIIHPVLQAYRHKKTVVEINPDETEASRFATIKLPMRAAEALNVIWQAYLTI